MRGTLTMPEDFQYNPITEYEFQDEFIGSGSATEFQLSEIATEIISVIVNGTETSSYTFDLENDTIILSSAPAAGVIVSVVYKIDFSYAQGPVKLASASDIARDESGVTKPYLHRRIDNELPGDISIDFHEEKFIGNGSTKVFTLVNHTDIEDVVEVTVNNQEAEYSFNSSNRKVTLTSAPEDRAIINIVYYLLISNVSPDQYSVFVGGMNSFRGVEHFYYDANSETSEIP